MEPYTNVFAETDLIYGYGSLLPCICVNKDYLYQAKQERLTDKYLEIGWKLVILSEQFPICRKFSQK